MHDVGVRLNGRRRHDLGCGGVFPWRRDGGRQPRGGGRRHRDVHRAGRGVCRGGHSAAQHQLLPPCVDLPAADAMLACYRRHRRTRRHALGHDLALLLSGPATPALAADGLLRTLIASAHMITRKSVPCVQRPVRHRIALRHGRHLARNAPRGAMWRPRSAYVLTVTRRETLCAPEVMDELPAPPPPTSCSAKPSAADRQADP